MGERPLASSHASKPSTCRSRSQRRALVPFRHQKEKDDARHRLCPPHRHRLRRSDQAIQAAISIGRPGRSRRLHGDLEPSRLRMLAWSRSASPARCGRKARLSYITCRLVSSLKEAEVDGATRSTFSAIGSHAARGAPSRRKRGCNGMRRRQRREVHAERKDICPPPVTKPVLPLTGPRQAGTSPQPRGPAREGRRR